MTSPTADMLNRFARGLGDAFAAVARGMDAESQRFVAVRAAERILTGYLTPAGADDDDGDGTPMGFDVPELPVDESFEQSCIGFEWSMPVERLRDTTLSIEVGFNTYIRTIPSYPVADANKSFSHGRSALVEQWERIPVAALDATPLRCSIELARLPQGEMSMRVSLPCGANVQTALATLHGMRPYRGASELYLQAPDFASSESYEHAIGALSARALTAPPWAPAIDVRVLPSPAEPGCVRVLLRLLNATRPVSRQAAAFVDPHLYAAVLRVSLPASSHRSTEFRVLPNSYRYDRAVLAVGINCQPLTSQNAEHVCFTSETVPRQESPRIVPRVIGGALPRFDTLSTHADGTALLRRISEAMRRYDASEWESKIALLREPDELADACADRELFRAEIRRFDEGIDLIAADANAPAARAFRLMNETMRRLGASRPRRRYEQWHLFQLVYIVSMLPSLSCRGGQEHRSLSLLWFPAGGGKTEAFLGLLLWHAFYDRLRGKVLGTTAFVRYPLRLLTYQQLQRLSRALGCADLVRIEEGLGGQSFSVGYLVGESTTPNRVDDKRHSLFQTSGIPANYQRVFECPACGARSVSLRYNASLRLIEHYCGARSCPSRGSRLPIYIVDDDVYRYLPTVIVSTVDKLAGLGQNRRFAQLFGRINLFCAAHGAAFGASNSPLCDASSGTRAEQQLTTCSGQPVAWGPFEHLAPSLQIQDELHLLRESLATFDAHYETTVLALQHSLGTPSTEWSLVGATATIEGYREQAMQLYLAEAQRFPAPGPEAFDSFYYQRDTETLGRIYVGLLGVGRTHTPAVARTLFILHMLIEQMRRDKDTALDDVSRRFGIEGATAEEVDALAFLYEVVLTYVLTRKGGDQVGEAIDSRVRAEVERVSEAPLRIETFHGSIEMPEMIAAMEAIEGATASTPMAERIRSVVATNIISHGVDIDRFNVMVFAGFPKHISEYIQASARVGRQWPALAVFVATPQAERDRSVLHRFAKFHQYVDRLVEPVPINRWLEPALQLSIPGLIVAYLQGVVPHIIGREIYLVRHVRDAFGMPGMSCFDESAVVQWVLEALGAAAPSAPSDFAEIVRALTTRLYGRITGATDDVGSEPLNSFMSAMRSLRDVDEPAWIVATDQAAHALRRLGL